MRYHSIFCVIMFIVIASSCDSERERAEKQWQLEENQQQVQRKKQEQYEQEKRTREENSERLRREEEQRALKFKSNHSEMLLTNEAARRDLAVARAYTSYNEWNMFAYAVLTVQFKEQVSEVRLMSEPPRYQYVLKPYLSDIVQFSDFSDDVVYKLLDDTEHMLESKFPQSLYSYRVVSRDVYGYFTYANASRALAQRKLNDF